MPRKKGIEITTKWHVVKDSESGELMLYSHTRFSSSPLPKGFCEVAILRSEEDAKQFIEFKNMGLSADYIDFIQTEHNVKGRSIKRESLDGIANNVDEIKKTTGRDCFGNCHSGEKPTASCQICHSDLHDTWKLCALLKIAAAAPSTKSRKKSGI